MAAITISNLRINPYTQKNTIKPVYGDTVTLTFALPEPFMEGDDYILALDYERVLVPTARPLCAMTSEYTIDGGNITFALELRTARFRDWVSTIKKPMPVWLQIQRKRDGVYDTILLDDVLALPSVTDGDNTVFPGDPLEELLDEKLDKPTEAGKKGDVLTLGANGENVWGKGGGGGGSQVQADWDESDSSEPSYIENKPTIPAPQVRSDWDESDSNEPSYIQHKPALDYIPSSEKGAVNGVATLDASGKLSYSQMPVLMLDSAPTTSTAGALTQQAFVSATGKSYQCIGIDSTDPNAPVYQWAEYINSANLPAIPPETLRLDAAPTTATAGEFGQHAIVTATGKEYTCQGRTNTGTEEEPVWSYTWVDDINAKGGNFTGAITVNWGDKRLQFSNTCIGIGYFPNINTQLGQFSNIVGGHSSTSNSSRFNIIFGMGVTHTGTDSDGGVYFGKYNIDKNIAFTVGGGSSGNNRLNVEELSWSGDLYIYGGHQQQVHVIPAATTAYTPADGVFKQTPSEAPTYTLSTPTDTTRTHHVTLNVYFRGYARSSDDDGNGYYAWKDGSDLLYTDTATPTATETIVYSDTALSTSVGTVALYEGNSIALAASASFEDAAGNDIVPRSTPTIKPGTVVQYLCEWEPCTSQWVIMPIPMVDGGAA